MIRGIRTAVLVLGLAFSGVLPLAAADNAIKITDFKLLYPTDDSFQIVITAAATGETSVGSYGIRSSEKLLKDDVPAGFVLDPDGYARPEKRDIPNAGYRDNGPFDEDPRPGVYAQTFSTKGWKSGGYIFQVVANNRPAAGPYIFDYRVITITINSAGKIAAATKPAVSSATAPSAADGVIKITDFKLLYPTDDSFQIVITASATGATAVGSYSIRSLEKVMKDDVPAGFVFDPDGYARPEKREIPDVGDRDNGPLDEDSRPGVYARTFSTKSWKPGLYTFQTSANNRPATGPYVFDRRVITITVNPSGKVGVSSNLKESKNIIIYKRAGAYACFPSLIQTADGVLATSFGAQIKRSHIETAGENITMCSRDNGSTWTRTTEYFRNPKLRSKDGRLVGIDSGGWRFVPDSERARLEKEGRFIRDVKPGTIAYLKPELAARISSDNGKTWQVTSIPVPEYISGLHSYKEEADYLVTSRGTILRAVYGLRKGVKFREVFFCRSADNGGNWQFIPLLPAGLRKGPGCSETSLLETRDGKILAMMRSDPDGYLYQSFSSDEGLSWSPPEKTAMWGNPAHLLALSGSRILCTYGYRTPPMGIRACLSRDNGRNWDIADEYILRSDGQGEGMDLGYPVSVLLSDGAVFTIYYFTAGDSITHIAATIWRL